MTTDYIINQMEVYAKIKGFENLAISNFGELININTGDKIKQFKGNGYLQVTISGKKYYVHRLVGLTYLDRIEGKNIIDHKDGNRTNNNVINLRWASSSENNQNRKISSRKNESKTF